MTTIETWQHRYIETNGIRMHYVTLGEGGRDKSAPYIVLLHGFPEFWYPWRYQIPFLAEHGYAVVAPDLRGYNDTDKPPRGYDVPTLIRDIEGLIKGLGQERAIIVGHDWGGLLAWAFAARYPEMTERLIVMNAPHPKVFERELRTLKQLRKSSYVFFFQLPWLPEYLLLRNNANGVGRSLRAGATQKSAFPREITAHYQQAMSKPGAMTSALNYYREAFRHLAGHMMDGKNRIRVPTLLIWGEQDRWLGIELTYGLERWVDDIEIRRIPDSGHWVQQEKPDLVNQYMLEFLQRQ